MKNYDYPHLFSPIIINHLRFPNRIMIAPMGNSHSESCKDFSKTGASVMTLGSWQVDDEWSMLMGYPSPYQKPNGIYVHKKSGKKELQKCLAELQRYGMHASIELIHAGRYAHNFPKETNKDGLAIGPITETYWHKKGYEIHVQGMDKSMIEHVAENYAAAAKFHKELGFDMIMLHFAHGWLPWQFLSPTYNHRNDEFGGSLENRMRFPKLIIEKVREAVGPDFPIELRIGGEEYREGGFNIKECCEFVKHVEHLIDIVHVSGGLDSEAEVVHFMMAGNLHPHCDKLHLAAEVKKHVKIPVCAVGSFIYPHEAEEAIASGKCDLVAIGREMLVDLNWVHKAKTSNARDIYPCLRCTACKASTVGCASNPRRSDREIPDVLPLAPISKRLVIVGGGPAGIRAALTGVQRGHQVILFEKTDSLGGQIKHFDNDKFKIDLSGYYHFLMNQINKYKNQVDIRLNCAPNAETLKQLNPDMLLIAIGAKPTKPRLKGIELPHVLQAIDVYAHPHAVKGDVVIIGGGPTGVETALYLDDLGHKCTVIEMTNRFYTESSGYLSSGTHEIDWVLKSHPEIQILLNTSVKEIRNTAVIVDSLGEKEVKADTVILATGLKPEQSEIEKYYDICYDTYLIGDCKKARTLAEATNEAFYRVMEL